MSDPKTRERARQVGHELCIRERDDDALLCAGGRIDRLHSALCDATTDALLAFADVENEQCERIARALGSFEGPSLGDAIAARRKERP